MRIKVAAAAPEIFPGRPGQNMGNVLAVISRAREDGAAILVLPAGLPEDMNRGAIERQAGKMAVYPLLRPSLTAEELVRPQEPDILCCSADRPATATSRYENEELAAMASYENMALVVMACPLGGDGGQVYTGQCVIAQNGRLLKSEDGYVSAVVTVPRRDAKHPEEGVVDSQPLTPWTPFPEMLPRILRLQADALGRRMLVRGATQLSLKVGEDASSLLALCVCAAAVDRLKLSRKNIHVTAAGLPAERIAGRMGATLGAGQGGLAVDAADLTARCLEGAAPEHYAVNATIPRSAVRLVLRTYANTCGDRELSIPIRAVVGADEEPWELYDFLLHFTLLHGLPKWGQARLLEDTFQQRYPSQVIQEVLDRYFDRFHRPAPCDCPAIFSLEPKAAT